MLNRDIFRHIFKYLPSLISVYNLAKTSKKIYSLLNDIFLEELKVGIIINGLNQLGLPGKKLVKFLAGTKGGMIMSGSFFLQTILGEKWKEPEIDIFYLHQNQNIKQYKKLIKNILNGYQQKRVNVSTKLIRILFSNSNHGIGIQVTNGVGYITKNTAIRIFDINIGPNYYDINSDELLLKSLIDSSRCMIQFHLSFCKVIFDGKSLHIPKGILQKEGIILDEFKCSPIPKEYMMLGEQLATYIPRGFRIKNLTENHIESILLYFSGNRIMFRLESDAILQILKIFNWDTCHFGGDFYQIGVKTGPNNDFICVKKCDNLEDAILHESPKILEEEYIKGGDNNTILVENNTMLTYCIRKTIKKYADLI